MEFVKGALGFHSGPVVEFGSKDVNGSTRKLFPCLPYTGVDLAEGPGVDVVADAAEYQPEEPAGVVVCTEAFEHCKDWGKLVENAHRILRPGGKLIVTCATGQREPHSAVDGKELRKGEHYANVDPKVLETSLRSLFKHVWLDTSVPNDLYAVAVK